jgi:cell division protease FtsH
LNDKIGNISYYDSQGRDAFTKPYSDNTAKTIDEEVSKLIESQYQRAIQLLKDNKEKLQALADKLLTSEVIFKEDLEAIFGKRQWDKEATIEVNATVVEGHVTEQTSVSSEETNNDTEDSKKSSESDNHVPY